MNAFVRIAPIAVCTALMASCTGQTAQSYSPASAPLSSASRAAATIKTPALLTLSERGNLQYWQFRHGSKPPATVAHLDIGQGVGIAANGDELAIADQDGDAGDTALYNIATGKLTKLPDSEGIPVDVAMGRDTSIYVFNDAKPPNILMYPPDSNNPTELTCASLTLG